MARYWVGNGGDWNDTTHWSASSGGASGASVPINTDAVFFDASSFSANNQIVMVASGVSAPTCQSLDVSGVDQTGVEIRGNPDFWTSLTIWGGLVGSPNVRFGNYGASAPHHQLDIIFKSTGTSFDINPQSSVFDGSIEFNRTGGTPTWTLLSNLSQERGEASGGNQLGTINIINPSSTLNCNGYNLTCTDLTINASSAINFSTGTHTLYRSVYLTATSTTTSASFVFDLQSGFTSSGGIIDLAGNTTINDLTINLISGDWTFNVTDSLSGNVDHHLTVTHFYANSVSLTATDSLEVQFVRSASGGDIYFFDNIIFTGNTAVPILIRKAPEVAGGSGNPVLTSNVTASFFYVDVRQMTASGTNPQWPFNAYFSTDSGSNLYWVFHTDPGGNAYLQKTTLVGSTDAGDIQTMNTGKDDDGEPIYYELETQGIEFGNIFHRKQVSDKLVVFSRDGIDSSLQAKTDDDNYQDLQIDLSNRVNIGQNINLEGNTMKFKWFGEANETSPVLEGFYAEKITDLGLTNG